MMPDSIIMCIFASDMTVRKVVRMALKRGTTALLLVAALALCACEKPVVDAEDDSGQQPSAKEGNVTVSIAQMGETPFSAASRAEAPGPCSRINFAIYDSVGTRLVQTNQMAGDKGFGTASFQLAEGQYRLVAVAHSSDGNPKMTDAAKIQFTNANGFSDTFLYCGDIAVGSEPLALSLSLRRIVALCRFVIEDDMPASVKEMRFRYTGGSGAFDAKTGLGCVKSIQTVFFNAGMQPQQYDLYTFLHDTEGTINIQATAYDAESNIIAEQFYDVPLRQNRVTWLSGCFFTGSEARRGASATVTIDTRWGGEEHLRY